MALQESLDWKPVGLIVVLISAVLYIAAEAEEAWAEGPLVWARLVGGFVGVLVAILLVYTLIKGFIGD